jgi:hypothetical protein
MISHIEVGAGENLGDSFFDKSISLISQAVTFGPTLSVDLQAVFNRTVEGIPQASLTKQHIVEALATARKEGVDVERWLRARMLISTLASVAEAKYTARSVDEVWNSPESEGDLKGAVEDGIYAGLPTGQIGNYIGEALDRSERLIGQASVQQAISALAVALPDGGKLMGRRAVSIIKQALAET